MPQSRSAVKRQTRSLINRERNRKFTTKVKAAVKNALSAAEQGDKEAKAASFAAACSTIDHAARHGCLHRNNAARKKSRLAKRMNTSSQ